MHGLVRYSRLMAVGLVFAMAGFVFALSSSVSVSEAVVGGRAVGSSSPLRFTNPLVTGYNEYDLGDACLGSTGNGLLTRYVTAAGGLHPYRFTSAGTNSLSRASEGTFSTLELGLSGAIVGSVPYGLTAGNPQHVTVTGAQGLHFTVNVQDSRGTSGDSVTRWFNLFLVDGRTVPFRFAVSTLPDALLGAPYQAKLDVVGGTAPYTFSVISVMGAATSLSDAGLFLAQDGTLWGNPLIEGNYILSIRCTDAKSKVAASRDGTGSSQLFRLTVGANAVTSSDAVTVSCSVRGSLDRSGGDSLQYSGVVNALGQDSFKLFGSQIMFRLGDISIEGQLNNKGVFSEKAADGTQTSVKISPKTGRIDVRIRRGNLSNGAGASALADRVSARKPLQIVVGDAVATTEVLDFDTSVNGSRWGLNYALGRKGASAAGAFQIVSVKGKDGLSSGGLEGDAWSVKFVALPRTAVKASGSPEQSFAGITGVRISIGNLYQEVLDPARLWLSSTRVKYSGVKGDAVKRLTLDLRRGTGNLDTTTLAARFTGIPAAANSAFYTNLFFPLGLDLTRSSGAAFTGEHARRIFGAGTKYSDASVRR